MIEQLKFIENIGRFANVEAPADLKFDKLTLVYSENGRGKTTTCAILRSLSTGDATPILERHRLSAKTNAKAVITVDGSDVVFDGAAWLGTGPPVLVFDEHFVDANVHSGRSLEAGHRKNLHVLVIGEEGVKLQKSVEALGAEITKLNSTLGEKTSAITAEIRGPLSVDSFCDLPPVEDIDTKIDEATKSVSVLRDSKKVLDTPAFTAFALPHLRAEDIRSVLQATLSDIEQDALVAVSTHLAKLGEGAEKWASEGVEYLGDGEHCPFCGQDTVALDLIAHYRAYFSKAYSDHKNRITKVKTWLDGQFGGDALARIQRTLQQVLENHEFWSKYIERTEIKIDIEEIGIALIAARDAVLVHVANKASAPLEAVDFDDASERAIARYESLADEIDLLSKTLLALNEAVSAAKEKAKHGNLRVAESLLAKLEATKRRHEKAAAALCSAYLAAKGDKEDRQRKKDKAREALQKHRDTVFAKYRESINSYLGKFNADFRIGSFAPSDAAGVPSSTLEFIVNKTTVQTANAGGGKPSFATVLSTGDRNTLALAFFFASLRERASLDDAIIVIDDPACSLDDGRAFATVQEIRALIGKAKQVIVLAHSRPILCQLWGRADRDSTATLKICDQSGVPDASKFDEWDAEAASITEFDRQHTMVREYAEGNGGTAQDVVVALRPVLEGFLRVAFVEACPPERMLHPFITYARQATTNGAPILSDIQITELDDLREYTNQFHHKASTTWQENVANVNETQLKGFAVRVIEFTHIARP